MTQATITHSTIIRDVLANAGKLAADVSDIADTDDLYDAGLSSHASVSVMLGLEDALDIEFPDSLLRKSTFSSISSIDAAITQIEGDN